MAHVRQLWLLLCVALVCAVGFGFSPARGQGIYQFEGAFERDVNRYQWLGNVRIADTFGPWRVAAENRFLSDAFLLFRDQLSFRDENRFALVAERPLGSAMDLRLLGNGGLFSQSRVFSQNVYAGVRYRPASHAWVEARAGAAWDHRPGATTPDGPPPLRRDAGPAYGFDAYFAPPPVNDYRLQLEGQSAWQIIEPRRGRMVRLNGIGSRSFEGTDVDVYFGMASYRRDAYQAISFLNRDAGDRLEETIEATTSDTLAALVRITTPVVGGLTLGGDLQFDGMNRSVAAHNTPAEALFFDTAFRRRSVQARTTLAYASRRGEGSVTMSTGAQIERRRLDNRDDLPPAQAAQKSNVLRQADYDRGVLSIQARGHTSMGRLTASFDGTTSLLRHDTPDLNPDDRDELYQHALVGLLVRISRYFDADVRVFGTRSHTVYVKAVRSAENNVQRSLRLRPSVTWRPSDRTRFALSSEVRATYTVDDFVLAGRRPKDQSARELRYESTFEHHLGSGVVVRTSGSFSDLHLGRLLWSDFAEIPFDTLRTYSGWIRVQAGQRIVADLGLRVFVRRDFDRATTVRYPRREEDGSPVLDEEGEQSFGTISRPGRTWIQQIGPTCSVTWPLMERSRLRLDGWLNVQRVNHRLYGALPEHLDQVIRRAASRGTVRIIPNVAMSILWNL